MTIHYVIQNISHLTIQHNKTRLLTQFSICNSMCQCHLIEILAHEWLKNCSIAWLLQQPSCCAKIMLPLRNGNITITWCDIITVYERDQMKTNLNIIINMNQTFINEVLPHLCNSTTTFIHHYTLHVSMNSMYHKANSYYSKYRTNTTQQVRHLRKVIKNSHLSLVGHEMEPQKVTFSQLNSKLQKQNTKNVYTNYYTNI